jgi:acyl carrier protein
MTRETLMEKLAGWIAEVVEEEAPPPLTAETHLVDDLGLDSLALAELAAKVRLGLQVRLRPGELRADLRVGALVDLVLARLDA